MSNLWGEFEKQIGSFCGYVPPGNFDYSINISLKYKYIYTETPKVACSTIKSILQKMELEDPSFYRQDFEDIHNRNFSPLLRPAQVGDFEKLVNDSMFKFCFSRNPYSRLLSVYLEKICGNKPQKRQILMHLGRNPSDIKQNISFDEFISVVFEQPIANMDPHWRVQYYQTFQRTLQYDFIGKIEAFPADLYYVLGKINKNYDPYITDERRHSQNSNARLREFYTPDLIKKVQTKFSKDFNFFGYEEDIEVANKPMQPTVRAAVD